MWLLEKVGFSSPSSAASTAAPSSTTTQEQQQDKQKQQQTGNDSAFASAAQETPTNSFGGGGGGGSFLSAFFANSNAAVLASAEEENRDRQTISPQPMTSNQHDRKLPKLCIPHCGQATAAATSPDEDDADDQGVGRRPRSILETCPEIVSGLCRELDSSFERENITKWTQIFSSDSAGRSFPRFSSALGRIRGSCLILIEEDLSNNSHTNTTTTDEEHPQQHAINDHNNTTPNVTSSTTQPKRSIFGGVCLSSQWQNVKTREHNAKAAAAARAREARGDGGTSRQQQHQQQQQATKKKDDLQAPQFFGHSDCFVFRLNNTTENENENNSATETDDAVRVGFYKPRTSGSLMNHNFMYFFDVHPNASLVGIGMGGTGAKSCVGHEAGMAWFLERSLTRGSCALGGCTTFHDSENYQPCPPLFSSHDDVSPSFKVKSVEVWGLNPELITATVDQLLNEKTETERARLRQDAQDDESAQLEATQQIGGENTASSPALTSSKHAVAKKMLQLNGATMWSEQNDRQDI